MGVAFAAEERLKGRLTDDVRPGYRRSVWV